jgi:hypothetical protein
VQADDRRVRRRLLEHPRVPLGQRHAEFRRGADDTGVIVSWNTEAATVDGTNPVLLPGGPAIDPITWTRTEEQATAAQNLGSVSLDPKTGPPVMDADGQPAKVMGLAKALMDTAKGVVICDSVNPADYAVDMPVGVFHPFDHPFDYVDVRANAAERVAKYLAKWEVQPSGGLRGAGDTDVDAVAMTLRLDPDQPEALRERGSVDGNDRLSLVGAVVFPGVDGRRRPIR